MNSISESNSENKRVWFPESADVSPAKRTDTSNINIPDAIVQLMSPHIQCGFITRDVDMSSNADSVLNNRA